MFTLIRGTKGLKAKHFHLLNDHFDIKEYFQMNLQNIDEIKSRGGKIKYILSEKIKRIYFEILIPLSFKIKIFDPSNMIFIYWFVF